MDGGERNEGGQVFGKVLEVLGEPPVSPEPGEGALDYPAARQDDKAFHVIAALDDFHAQQGHVGGELGQLSAGIGTDTGCGPVLRGSTSAQVVTPGLRVDLLNNFACRQLVERLADRAEGNRCALVALDRATDLDGAHRTRRIGL